MAYSEFCIGMKIGLHLYSLDLNIILVPLVSPKNLL